MYTFLNSNSNHNTTTDAISHVTDYWLKLPNSHSDNCCEYNVANLPILPGNDAWFDDFNCVHRFHIPNYEGLITNKLLKIYQTLRSLGKKWQEIFNDGTCWVIAFFHNKANISFAEKPSRCKFENFIWFWILNKGGCWSIINRSWLQIITEFHWNDKKCCLVWK